MQLFRLAALAVSVSVALMSAELGTRKYIPLELAKKVAAAAEQEAIKNKWNVVISIVDDSGHLIYLQRIDDTQTASVEIATAKARSAAMFRRPTKTFEEALVGGRQAILKLPGAIPVEGGIPLQVDGKTLGAIGVSGVTSQQDGQIAKAGADAFDKLVK